MRFKIKYFNGILRKLVGVYRISPFFTSTNSFSFLFAVSSKEDIAEGPLPQYFCLSYLLSGSLTRFKIQTLEWIPDPKQTAQSPRGRHSFHHLLRDRHRVLLSQPVVTPANNDSFDNCPKSRPNPRGRKISSPSPTISTSTLSSPGSSNPKS